MVLNVRARGFLGALALALGTGLSSTPATAGSFLPADIPIVFDQFQETGTLQGSRPISGPLGGVLQVGRWTVIVPPGAISGQATITVTVPDRSKLECQLTISPASANNFRLPVTLLASGSGGSITDPKLLRMYWFNPAAATWDDVTGSVNPGTLVLAAQLRHFSTYAGGRAGW